MELKINDKVKVINNDHSYPQYTEIAKKMSLTNYKKGSKPIEGEIYKIIKTENHIRLEDVIVYAIESDTGEHFLIDKNGLQLTKSFKGYRLNPDYFNDFIFLVLMNNIPITNISLNIDDKRIINFLKEKNLLDVWTKPIYKEQKEEKVNLLVRVKQDYNVYTLSLDEDNFNKDDKDFLSFLVAKLKEKYNIITEERGIDVIVRYKELVL